MKSISDAEKIILGKLITIKEANYILSVFGTLESGQVDLYVFVSFLRKRRVAN